MPAVSQVTWAARLGVNPAQYTDTTQQSHKAELQHQDLKAALLRVGYTEDNIHVHVIVLGVAGTIYRRKKERLPPNEWRLVEEGGEHGQHGLKSSH